MASSASRMKARRVMEWGDELDLRIVNRGRFDLHAGSRRQAAEEIHHASRAAPCQGLLPGRRIAGGFDHGIRAALVFGQISHRGHDIADLRDVDGGNRAHAPGNFEGRNTARQSNHADAAAREHADILQANGAAADTTAVSPVRTSIS